MRGDARRAGGRGAGRPGPPRGEGSLAPAPPPAGGATPRPRVRARPRATRLGVRGAAAEAGPGGRQKMARVCSRQQCSVERRGFRQELDSWRHKLIHCVGESLHRCRGPPGRPPPVRGREQGSGRRAPAPRAVPGSGPLPHPPERERAAAVPLPSAGGAGSDARPLLSGRIVDAGASGRRRQRAGTHGVAATCPGPAPLPHAGGAPPCPRARAAALGRVRGVRWRWGRREPELSQAPSPPERAKWGCHGRGGQRLHFLCWQRRPGS